MTSSVLMHADTALEEPPTMTDVDVIKVTGGVRLPGLF